MLALSGTRPLTTEELLAWLAEAGAPLIDASTANEAYILHHPRTCFLKTLPKDAVICDVGAGAGMLPVFRRWPGLLREDLRFVGVSLFRPEKDGRIRRLHRRGHRC